MIQIPMQLRFVPVDEQHPNRVAIMYGPVILVEDARWTRVLTERPTNLSAWMVRTGKPLEFKVVDQSRLYSNAWGTFVPFYQPGEGIPYFMHFDLGA